MGMYMSKLENKATKNHSNWTTRNILAINVTYLRHEKGWSQEEWLCHSQPSSWFFELDLSYHCISVTMR